ncbi:latrophilin Cirl-like isoform X3 [Cimex lectularius]|uniref:Latrophilin Cirl n=1 Tax=Cimex lectularius TaxID=79782 RepID=A0A8I6RP21_CIMLE|nr:latrophilin Cirl-like isoform X3 [Cimex lectularius]
MSLQSITNRGRAMVHRGGFSLLLLCLFSIARSLAKNQEQPRYDTAYACEGKTLRIDCKDGELINLIRANYGRFSITICNDHGNTEWSVNCMSPKSLRVLHARCSQQQNCSIQASTSLFGEPCAGTLKYLEAHYQCIPPTLTTTTIRPSPPWLITSQPSVWSTAKAVTLRPPVPTPPPPTSNLPSTSSTTSSVSTTNSTTTEANVLSGSTTTLSTTVSTTSKPLFQSEFQENPSSTTLAHPTTTTFVPSSPVSLHSTGGTIDESQMCVPELARGLKWNWTKVGDAEVQPCPGGASGLAKWKCVQGPPPRRLFPTPDLSECRSVWLTSLDTRITEGDSIINIANDLSQVTDSKTLYGGDMMTTTLIMRRMAQKMANDISTFPDPRQREAIVTELLLGVVKTGSNLLDPAQLPSWRDLTYKDQMSVATSLIFGIEENSFLLADTVIREKTVKHKEKNIFLAVKVIEIPNVITENFNSSNFNEGESGGDGGENWLRLEKRALLDNTDSDLLRLVYVAFDRLEEILQPLPMANVSRIVNSKVISASLGKGRHIQLSQPVTICLKHIRTENVTNPTCVFWDYLMSSWSEEGCQVQFTNLTHTICICDHLTNFAILMDIQATYLPPMHQMALQIITYVGCIISIICLVLSIITFQLFRGLKSDRTTIHKNLCICLLIAEVLFVAGVGKTDQAILCGIIAGLLHFFFLCAFAWMFLEGFQLYVMLIEVFEAEKSRLRWYYLFAYGAPLVVVIVSCLIDPFSYGTDRYCWLRADNFFIFSFVGPVIAVILANLVFLTMAIYMMCRHSNASIAMKSKEHSRLASARAWLRGAIILVFLLGLTWLFGLLYLNEESVVMAYVFTCLNSTQGLFIFVFHCIQNDKVQKEYRKFFRRHVWLSKCLGCQESGGGVSGSGGESKERRTSLYTGSHGNAQSTESTSASSTAAVTGPAPPHGTSHCGPMSGWPRGVTKENEVEVSIATLPYVTRPTSRPTGFLPLNIPKSATTWGPLHKPFIWKNISFKSFSRDSGHGGSEQEDSPKAHTTVLTSNSLLRHKERPSYMTAAYSHSHLQPQLQHVQAATMQHRNKRPNGTSRATSPWNHTYTEIREREQRVHDDDPVYEEIERERAEIQVSDMSDEDGRRQSDMSRQSSRSYGDHRPLIPYSPAADRNFHTAFDAAFKQRLKEQAQNRANAQQGTVAVLDGETVVCHLQPEYTTRTMLQQHQPYSEC